MEEDNLSAVLYKTNDLRLEQRPIPEPEDNEVLIQMGCVGICGSDVSFVSKGRVGKFVIDDPVIIGHEPAGTVVKLGKDVKNLSIGDRVAIEPGVPCRECQLCKEGKYNLCHDIVFKGVPPYDGSLARYRTHAADFCFKLPDNVSMEEGAFLEPMAVSLRACRRAGVSIGSKVLILGSGSIGLLTLLVAKAMGATEIISTDVNQHKLDIAKELGANYGLLVERNEDEKSVKKKIQQILGGNLPDLTIDCSGSESAIRLGMEATKSGGVFMIIGIGPNNVTLPLVNAIVREVDVKGSFRFAADDYPIAIAMVSSGLVNLKPLITHHFKLEETEKAFETLRTGEGDPVKVMIHCQK